MARKVRVATEKPFAEVAVEMQEHVDRGLDLVQADLREAGHG